MELFFTAGCGFCPRGGLGGRFRRPGWGEPFVWDWIAVHQGDGGDSSGVAVPLLLIEGTEITQKLQLLLRHLVLSRNA